MKAIVHTSMGDIALDLLPDHAPNTVNNFVGLARGEREWTDPRTGQKTSRPLYDGTVFHRVIKDFMIQGGDPLGNGTGGPGYRIHEEFSTNPRNSHEDGALAMARSQDPNSAGSQFYFCLGPQHVLDSGYTVFGATIEGKDVIGELRQGDVIESIRIEGATA